MEEPLAGDAQLVGEAIVSQLQALPEGCYLWGGETTVALPETTGTGGRNTHLALAAARRMTLRDSMVILAAGTDGTDGPTGYAGAIVDASTLRRGQRQGFDAQVCLQQADSARYLATSGDLLQTGPTGTNVMDMVVACKGDCTPVEHDTSEDSS
jgi:hydroxypyruvate reductase